MPEIASARPAATITIAIIAAALVAGVVLGAFIAGWWMGRAERIDSHIDNADEARLSRLEEKLDDVRLELAALASGAGGSAAGGAALPQPGLDPDRVYEVEVGGAPVKGPEDAPVTIVEFSDFECPYCASAVATMERVLAEYEGRVRLVFKHHPLPLHRSALLAHRAAAAAHRQGKFWEMHDLLFGAQERLDAESVKEHARTLGLDIDAFEKVFASAESTRTVNADQSQAARLGILGVPAFFINGRFLPGAQPFEVFQERIERELAEKG
jgi:protein-disulfide isomerase